jgi:hypothetical protein
MSDNAPTLTAEEVRLAESQAHTARWRRWGTYLSERQWGTVREDYSADGDVWDYFRHDDAPARAYRWGEDGLLGISDDRQHLCFALALWNGKDTMLKERLFGLTNPQGNHGEDVKEYYYFLDNTPTHSYAKALYKYPQAPFPYAQLISVNGSRTRTEPEYELIDTGIFDEDRYFDITVEYAKASPEDICIEIAATNRGPDAAQLHLLPTLWFRNTWSWTGEPMRPAIMWSRDDPAYSVLKADHERLGTRWMHVAPAKALLFTENDTNQQRILNVPNRTPYVKDAFHEYVIRGNSDAVNPKRLGTKAAALYELHIAPGETARIRVRLSQSESISDPLGASFSDALVQRRADADEFYARVSPYPLSDEARRVQRQAFAGMLWCKQYYNYIVYRWLKGDSAMPAPSPQRRHGRNHNWRHLEADDILSMPDNWEFSWFAAWDTAFHCITLAMIDPLFAKRQLDLLTREWYMHPNGELPAYEWAFGDANPPVHAWAALRVYKIEQKMYGRTDRLFLERVFQKLLLNFTWWCNRQDAQGNNVFQGGFLGLDNIGAVDRGTMLPDNAHLDQADGTSWMGVYCLSMLAIALELAPANTAYEDIATKFFEHFVYIADAINGKGDDEEEIGLWDAASSFYYDALHYQGKPAETIALRSMVGLLPLFAVVTADDTDVEALPEFRRRVEWFIRKRPDLHARAANLGAVALRGRRLLSIVGEDKMRLLLAKMLDESEFLSSHGVRSLSKYHEKQPFRLDLGGKSYVVDYEPAESKTALFGGNSNWRGPIWFPTNYFLIEALQRFHYYYGDEFKIECPTGSGNLMNLWEVSMELSHRLIDVFMPGPDGRRPMLGSNDKLQTDPHFRGLLPFYEYFHGDTGAGLGAMHQTGWTGLVAKLLQQCSEYCGQEKDP